MDEESAPPCTWLGGRLTCRAVCVNQELVIEWRHGIVGGKRVGVDCSVVVEVCLEAIGVVCSFVE